MRRTFVVGMGSLPAACCEILRAAGFELLGVHAPDGSLEGPCRASNAPYVSSREAFADRLRSEAFDYLFSLNNPWIIPDELSGRALAEAINYHDSPLPRYAGLNATSWALLHGETSHAVTFHRVTAAIDGGAILKQRVVPILPDDSARTLNARCFEAALEAFGDLARELADGRAIAMPQPPGPGSYFGRRERPPRAATLDLRRPAAELVNLVRALDFGNVDNPLGTAKLFLGGEVAGMRRVDVRGPASAPAGTLLGWTDDSLDVATADRDITIGGFVSLEGSPLSLGVTLARQRVAKGDVLPSVPEATATDLDALLRRVCTMEPRWVRTLARFSPTEPPHALGVASRPGATAPLPELQRVLARVPEEARSTLTLAALVVALSRLGESAEVGIGLVNELEGGPLSHWLQSVVPFVLEADPQCTLGTLLERVEEQHRLALSGSYARDLFARFPALAGKSPPRYGIVLRAPGVGGSATGFATADVASVLSDLELNVPLRGCPELVHHGALESWQVESLDRCLAALVETLTQAPGTPVSAAPLLSPEDRQRVIVEWNATARPIPEGCIHALIAEVATRNPDAPAVRFGGRSLTYGELMRRSAAVAGRLVAAGVETGHVVALSAPRSLDVVVGMLGILQAGAAYMPIDPSYPEARGRGMLTDAAVGVAVTTPELSSKYFGECSVILLSEDEKASPAELAVLPSPRAPTADDLVYVIYTSGSTGKPKGVEVRHRGLVNHGLAIARNYELGSGDRLLCSASISFDVAAEQIYPALLAGAEVVVRSDDLFESFTRFDEFLRAERISVMVLPTAFWHEWIRDMEARGSRPPENVRVLCVGTEKALGEHFSSWQRLSQGRVRFFQGYGPTEATVTCTMFAHDGTEPDPSRPLPIGRPLPNTRMYLLDAFGGPVPIGAPGELHVGGAGLARGYRNNPEMTRDRFVPDPFIDGERVYRTGDLGRFDPDGQIVFVGRRDSQVKVRGFRVELGEIEQVLREHPSVDEATVLLRSDYGAPELVAYVVPRGDTPESGVLLEFVRARVPEYMVPRAVVPLGVFPKTPNQKVDRSALPPPPRAEASGVSSVLPRDERERALHEIWQQLFPGSPFGVEDDFFVLGGNSLSAVRMLTSVELRFGARVPLSQFATGPTVAALSRGLSAGPIPTSIVVRVQAGDSRPPLWVIHPVGGHVVYAQTLRRHMHPKQPIRGIQSRGLDGRETPLDSIEEMAALYVDRMVEEQPGGPYLIAGPSMGGLVAYEMAQLLRRRGRRVALLALLDTWGPNYPAATSRWLRLADQLETIRSQPSWRRRVELLRDRLRSRPLVSPFGASGTVVPPRYEVLGDVELPADLRQAILEVTRANERANVSYRPAPYEGRMLLLRAANAMRWSGMRFDDSYNGWKPLVRGGVERVVIQCNHSELADDPPPEAARALQDAVDRALVSSPPSRRSFATSP